MYLSSNWGVIELPDNPDELEILNNEDVTIAFTKGQCHSLAIALHQITGWQTVGLFSPYDAPDSPGHCAVLTPDGAFFDITGIDNSPWLETCEIRPFDISTVTNYRKPQPELARPYAEALLRLHFPELVAQRQPQAEQFELAF